MDNDTTILCATVRAAVEAKLRYWDAMDNLEAALGYPNGDIPDKLSDVLVEHVEWLACGCNDSADAIAQEDLLTGLPDPAPETTS